MTLRAGNLFYFPFSAADQEAIDETTLTIDDAPFAAAPVVGTPYPQSMRLRFPLKPGRLRVPRLRPLAPGTLTFLAEASPDAETTTGTLLLDVSQPDVITRMRDIAGLPVVPNRIWYSKVALTRSYLRTWLPLLRPVPIAKSTGTILPGAASWTDEAIAGFLAGTYHAEVVAGDGAAGDTVATVDMPPLVRGADGWFELMISAAFVAIPFDGLSTDYEVASGVPENHPAHPSNGALPARVVYRALRTGPAGATMDGAATGLPTADKVLDPLARYHAIRFTRVWRPIEDCSVHFPSQVVTCIHPAFAIAQRLPAHGMLYIPLTPEDALQGGTNVRLSLRTASQDPRREMRWLDGGVDSAWRSRAQDRPLDVDLARQPHVVMRRRMGQEVIYDRKERPYGSGCTYFSLRRSVRALVNNRIAGGRLNFEVYYDGEAMCSDGSKVAENSEATARLVTDALGPAANEVLDAAPIFRGADIGDEADRLKAVLEAFYSADVGVQNTSGGNPLPYAIGKAAYYVWQSSTLEFSRFPARRAFAPEWIAGGAAGALVAMGEAASYAVCPWGNVGRQPGNNSDAMRDAIVDAMLVADLQPGAALQFWEHFEGLDEIRSRQPVERVGHSLIFLQYVLGDGDRRIGIDVLDQTGSPLQCLVSGPAGRRLLEYSLFEPDAWVAANWDE